MVSNLDQLANEGVGLDLAVLADLDPLLDFYKGANASMVTDKATIQINGFYDDDVLSENDIPDTTLFQDRIVCHEFTLIEVTRTGPGSGFG